MVNFPPSRTSSFERFSSLGPTEAGIQGDWVESSADKDSLWFRFGLIRHFEDVLAGSLELFDSVGQANCLALTVLSGVEVLVND